MGGSLNKTINLINIKTTPLPSPPPIIGLLNSQDVLNRWQVANCFGKFGGDFREPIAFGSRNPLQTQPFWLKTGELQYLPENGNTPGGAVIAVDIVTVAEVTTHDDDAVGAFSERS